LKIDKLRHGGQRRVKRKKKKEKDGSDDAPHTRRLVTEGARKTVNVAISKFRL